MNADGSKPEEDDHSDQSVCNGVPRRNQWAVCVCSDLSPVESNWQERDPAPATEELVDNDIVGSYPAGEAKDAQEWRNEAWKPVPAERACEDNKEVSVSRDGPAVGLGWIGSRLVMEAVEEGGVDKTCGPNHGSCIRSVKHVKIRLDFSPGQTSTLRNMPANP